MSREPALDLGVVVPDLRRRGGAERLALACIERWSDRFCTTLYSTGYADEVAGRLGPRVALRTLSPAVSAPHGTREQTHARLLNGLSVPALWGEEIGEHDVYLAHQWPAQRVRRRPLVWYAHEPRRALHDLRYEPEPDDLVAWMERVRARAGDRWDHALDRRQRAVQALLDEAERRDRPERVVTNSRFTAEGLRRILGGPMPDVVHPGVDVDAYEEPAFDEPFFLVAGAFARHKQPRLLLEALALAPDARLVMTGADAMPPRLAAMAEALGVTERLELRGDVSDAELRDLLRRCRGVPFFPIREPFGMAALEAMAAGKPLVCSGDGGYAEAIDERCALVVPPEPARIAEALEALLADPLRAQALGAHGRERARGFSWEATADALAEIVEETADAATTGAASPLGAPVSGAHRPGLAVSLRLGFGAGAAASGWVELRAAGRVDAPATGYYASMHGSTIERQQAGLAELAPDLVLLVVPVDASGPGLLEIAAAIHQLEIAARDDTGLRFAVCARIVPGGETRLSEIVGLVVHDLARQAPYASEDGRPRLFVDPGAEADETALREVFARSPDVAIVVLPGEGSEAARDVLRVPTERGEAPWKDAQARLRDAPLLPEWVVLDAWNDYASGRHLEPTRLEGRRRLELASELSRALRAGR